MMTRKHFRAAANTIRIELNATGNRDAAERMAETFGALFAADNPRFQWSTFIKACGLGPTS